MRTATVNYSVPSEVKEEFNRVFAKRNKSQIIAQYMMRAIEDNNNEIRRKKATAKIRKIRERMPVVDKALLDAERKKGRK